MPVFISYSHSDREFVDRLATQLVRNKVSIWLDRWEMHVGDSITNRIQNAITGASALLVVLSENSVQSGWCNRELNAGLIRELEESRVVVLPVLKENCQIPIFLRDKLYADFRYDPDTGLKSVLEAIASVTNEWQCRIDTPEWYMDWAVDYGPTEQGICTRLTIVEHAKGQPYSVLSVVSIIDDATKEHPRKKGREHVLSLEEIVDDGEQWTVRIEDQFEITRSLIFPDKFAGSDLRANISVRRLGDDTGRDTVFHMGQQIKQIAQHMQEVTRNREEI